MKARRHRHSGFSMVEILVTIVILTVGLLGLAALIIQGQRAQFEGYQRSQALILLDDMVARLQANRSVAPCYAITNAATGEPFYGVDAGLLPTCGLGTVDAYTTANADMQAISDALAGAGEVTGSDRVGAVIGGRGCISLDAATGTYTLSVAWLGGTSTVAPPAALNCATGLYGPDESVRRVVTTSLRIANLD